jgi:hypothetical protein
MLKYVSALSVMMGLSSGVMASTEMNAIEKTLELDRSMTDQETPPYDLTVKPKPAPVEEKLVYPSEKPESKKEGETDPREPSWYRDKDTVGGIQDRGENRTWR